MTTLRASLLLALLGLAAVLACDWAFPPPFEQCVDDTAVPEMSQEVTWHADIKPIVEGRCARCHHEQGLGGFSLGTYDDVYALRSAVQEAVVTRKMPPWMPARCCGPSYLNDSGLTPEQIGKISTWVDRGAPEGEPVSSTALEPVGKLSRVDLSVTMPEPYTPAPPEGAIDDTRCFLIDWPLDEPAFVTGFALRPGRPEVVHHALVLTIEESLVPYYESVDDATEGPGWSCPGGITGYFTGWLGGWSPGWEGQMMPTGHGHEVKPGYKLILTLHYSTPTEAAQLGEDQTTIDLVVEDEVSAKIRSVAVYNAFWLSNGMHIPAGERDVMFATQFDANGYYTPGETLTLLGANLHMHERGVAGTLGIRRADGTDECLLQIDKYDHAWQENYLFADPVALHPGDKVYVECHFDNSAENQRVILGEREEPRDLNWAEEGEMCIGFLTATKELDDTRPF